MKARMVSTVKDNPKATSTMIRPGMVLKMPRACISQMVGTTAGGMIRPASTKRLISGFSRLLRRSSTNAIIDPRMTSNATDATVRMMELMNAITSM